MTIEPWLQFVQVGGVATAMLAAIFFASWQGLKWAACKLDEWVKPIVTAHVALVNELREAIKDLRESLGEIKTEIASQRISRE